MSANQVAPFLWQGSAPPTDSPRLFEYVDLLALCAYEYQPPDQSFPGVVLVRAQLDDAEPSSREIEAAIRAAEKVATAMRNGQTCLVTCMAGLNRSGLVSGLALRMHGYTGRGAVQAVQRARGRDALGNLHFREIVRQAKL